MDFPEDLTYRQALEEYHGVWYPDDEPLTLSDYKELYYEYGISPREIDEPAECEFFQLRARKDSSNAGRIVLEP